MHPTTYRTATPNATPQLCVRGHLADRDKLGRCSQCRRDDARKRYHAKPAIAAQTKSRAVKWHAKNPEKVMLNSARNRAKRDGCPCTITKADIVIPEFCPLLGIRLSRNKTDASPSLDKIRPELGYVPGNVWVISKRANTIKSNATPEELQMLAANLKKHAFLRGAL